MPFMSRFGPLLGLSVLAACSGAFCTLIGCESGLTIAFTTAPTSPFHIDATVNGMGSFVYDCPEVTRCNTSPTLTGFVPDRAVITVTYQGRSASTEVHPVYHTFFPNGKDCGGGCTQATVSLPLP